MENRRNSRSLKQSRSFNTKQKILDTAYRIFCEKGYYKTTSIEISKEANVSIGCFYSYFKDKDAVFWEILNLYDKNFMKIIDEISNSFDIYKKDKQEWFLLLINKLINIHKKSQEFNIELNSLYRSNEKVALILNTHHTKIIESIKNFLISVKNETTITDIDAAAIITYDILNAVIDRVVFENNSISSDRILKSGIEAINKYLYK